MACIRYSVVLLLAFIWVLGLPHLSLASSKACLDASDRTWCEQRLIWYNTMLPKAKNGDYIAQREVSFCLSSGCAGAVPIDQVEACAWLNIIELQKQGDATDTHNLRSTCSALDDNQRNEAKTRTDSILASMPRKGLTRSVRQAPAIGITPLPVEEGQ